MPAKTLLHKRNDDIDNNCDGNIDENVTTNIPFDFDADGFGDANQTTQACELPADMENADDCDDIEVLIHPNAEEM